MATPLNVPTFPSYKKNEKRLFAQTTTGSQRGTPQISTVFQLLLQVTTLSNFLQEFAALNPQWSV